MTKTIITTRTSITTFDDEGTPDFRVVEGILNYASSDRKFSLTVPLTELIKAEQYVQ